MVSWNRATVPDTHWCLGHSASGSTAARDFVVGDLHGCFDLLERALALIHFNREIDRLFSVGDLIDRGPASKQAIHYLQQPWFFAVRGNHEDMLLRFTATPDALAERLWRQQGGGWWFDLDREHQEQLNAAFRALPLTLEFSNRFGHFGVVHADLPTGTTWQAFIAGVARSEEMAERALWGRTRVHQRLEERVAGIDLVFLGHTIVPEALRCGNCLFLDTGAFADPRYDRHYSLTLAEACDPLRLCRVWRDGRHRLTEA